MPIDRKTKLKKIKAKVSAYKKTNKAKQEEIQSKFDAFGDNAEQFNSKIQKKLSDFNDSSKKFSQNQSGQGPNSLDELLELFKLTEGSGTSTMSFLTKRFIRAANRTIDKLKTILVEETISSLGCSQEQSFPTATSVSSPVYYIRVPAIDLFSILKEDPDTQVGKLLYEKKDYSLGVYPYSMNRQLYHRIQDSSQSFLTEYSNYYVGSSTQPLFDIEYSSTDGVGNVGDFYKITLRNRFGNSNRIGDFLVDYYSSINLFDVHELYGKVMEALTGAISMKVNTGADTTRDQTTFERILQRILGLCFDTTKEIDVSGIAKLSVDLIDESFFEMSEIDLRIIDDRINNIQQRVAEFEDCDNVKLPVQVDDMLTLITRILNSNNLSQEDAAAESMLNEMVNEWKLLLPGVNIQLKVQEDFLKILPKAVLTTVLSPKNILPLILLSKVLGDNLSDFVDSLEDFAKKYKNYLIQVQSRIYAIYLEELYLIIKKDFLLLVQSIIRDIGVERTQKRNRMILTIVETLLVVVQGVIDYRRCNSLLDELLALLNIASRSTIQGPQGEIPLPFLFPSSTDQLQGMSATRIFANVIEEYESVGIPTGDYPGGFPNVGLQSDFAKARAHLREQDENGKLEVGIPPTVVVPLGSGALSTVPQRGGGKLI